MWALTHARERIFSLLISLCQWKDNDLMDSTVSDGAPGMLLWLRQLLEKNLPPLWTFSRTVSVRLTTAPRKRKMRPNLIKNDTQIADKWRKKLWLVFGLRMGGERFTFRLGWCVYSPSRTLRSSSDTRILKIQQYKRKTHGFRTFSCFGPHIWNSLPQDLRHCTTLSSFKAKLKTFLFSQYFRPK